LRTAAEQPKDEEENHESEGSAQYCAYCYCERFLRSLLSSAWFSIERSRK
jgi:hypothetical protein